VIFLKNTPLSTQKQKKIQSQNRPGASRYNEAQDKFTFLSRKIRSAYSEPLYADDSISRYPKALIAAIRAYLSGIWYLLKQDYRRDRRSAP
jgi:hypothetical protein